MVTKLMPANDSGFYEKIHKWLYPSLGEMIGNVFIISLLVGTLNGFFRYLLRFVLNKIGVEYFKKTQDSWKWIGTKLIMSMERMESDRIGFYSISNGKPFFDQEDWSDIKLEWTIAELKKIVKDNVDASDIFLDFDLKIESHGTTKVSNRGVSDLPEVLDIRKFKYLLFQIAETNNIGEFFTADLPEGSIFRKTLLDYGIEGYVIVKIENEDKRKLYGFVIYTYSNIKSMPVNLLQRKQEHLYDVRTQIRGEYETLLDLSVQRKTKRFFNNIFRNKRKKKDNPLTISKWGWIDKRIIYEVDSNITLENHEEFEKKTIEMFQESKKPYVFSLKENCYIDSSGIGTLISIANIHKALFGVKLRLSGLSNAQIKILNVAKLDNILEYEDGL